MKNLIVLIGKLEQGRLKGEGASKCSLAALENSFHIVENFG